MARPQYTRAIERRVQPEPVSMESQELTPAP
jgi:hypothetical protein